MIRSIFKMAALLLVTTTLFGCGFEDVTPEYPTKSMLFTWQQYKRDLVIGEGLKFSVGVVFAGLPEGKNDRDRAVKYTIDPSLVGNGQTLLPEDYYTCASEDKIVVKKGQLKGYMPVILDSAKFVADPKAYTGEYVLPVRISEPDADQITEGKDYTVISLTLKAKQFGNYTYSGVRTFNDGEEKQETYKNVSTADASVRVLQTAGPDTFKVIPDQNGTADPAKGKFSFMIQLPTYASGTYTVNVLADPASAVAVEAVGKSTYDVKTEWFLHSSGEYRPRTTKTFVLRYKYTLDGVEYTAEDTMVFRNRIRDDQGDGRAINEYEGF